MGPFKFSVSLARKLKSHSIHLIIPYLSLGIEPTRRNLTRWSKVALCHWADVFICWVSACCRFYCMTWLMAVPREEWPRRSFGPLRATCHLPATFQPPPRHHPHPRPFLSPLSSFCCPSIQFSHMLHERKKKKKPSNCHPKTHLVYDRGDRQAHTEMHAGNIYDCKNRGTW